MLLKFVDPRFAIALLIVCLFAWAYGENVGDQTMIGALIGAFNMAIGYYLGSSRGAAESNERTDKVLDIAQTNANANSTVGTVNVEAENVNVDKK